MLKEILKCNQSPGAGYRRWFADGYMELIVWYHDDDSVEGFQLCYPNNRRQFAFTWKENGNWRHNEIQSGSRGPFFKMSPILQPDGEVPIALVKEMFGERGSELEAPIKEMVEQTLNSLPLDKRLT